MLHFTEEDVRGLLPMREAIGLMRRVFEDLASGRALNQPRRRLVLPSGSVLHQMAGAFGEYFGTKIYSTNPRHGAHFLFALYEAETARPLALFEANWLGQIRTGAATGFATDLLALPEADTLAIFGAGFQARSQIEAIQNVRPLRRVRVWSRSPAKREQFAREMSESFQIAVEPATSPEAAVEDAKIIVTATNSKEPVIDGGWIGEDIHINAVGSNNAKRRELPAELIHRARLIAVDSIEQARIEAGDLVMALDERGWRDAKIRELSDLAANRAEPTRGITIFKSNGLGVEDVAAAAYVFETAKERNLRRVLPVYS